MDCARMVAVVVPSPATSEVLEATSRTICAPMFSSGSFSSISLATVTPSLVMLGPPNFFSRTTLRPLGASVTLTASASWLTPRRMACRGFSAYTICFSITFRLLVCFLGRLGAAFQNPEDLVLAHNQVLFVIQLDVAAGVLAEQDAVADLHVQGIYLAVFQALALAHGHYLALLGLLLGCIRNIQATLHLLLLLDPFDHDTVIERTNFHGTSTSNNEICNLNRLIHA